MDANMLIPSKLPISNFTKKATICKPVELPNTTLQALKPSPTESRKLAGWFKNVLTINPLDLDFANPVDGTDFDRASVSSDWTFLDRSSVISCVSSSSWSLDEDIYDDSLMKTYSITRKLSLDSYKPYTFSNVRTIHKWAQSPTSNIRAFHYPDSIYNDDAMETNTASISSKYWDFVDAQLKIVVFNKVSNEQPDAFSEFVSDPYGCRNHRTSGTDMARQDASSINTPQASSKRSPTAGSCSNRSLESRHTNLANGLPPLSGNLPELELDLSLFDDVESKRNQARRQAVKVAYETTFPTSYSSEQRKFAVQAHYANTNTDYVTKWLSQIPQDLTNVEDRFE
jgi:hypothetical protein